MPAATPFRPVGTDFICVEQIARYVNVIQRAFCITLTEEPENRAGQSPKSINLKISVYGKTETGRRPQELHAHVPVERTATGAV